MLHRSLEFLRSRTALPIIVVTDTRRNEIDIDHSTVIDVQTPDRLNHHQASIFLKTGLHRVLPPHRDYVYLDTDIVAVAEGVDRIFDHQMGPVSFAPDLPLLESCVATFSPWAVKCSCMEEGRSSCSHLTRAIECKFGVSVPDGWTHWNGGLFLFGPSAFPFLETWHTLTLQIFEDPYWRIRDQGTLIATVWKLGLQRLSWLPHEYNFIADMSNPHLRFDRAAGYSLHESSPGIHPKFLHLIHSGFDASDWSLARNIEAKLEERSRRAAVRPTAPHGPMLSVVADRLTPKLPATSPVASRHIDCRVIVGRPRWSLSGESILSETLVRGLRKRGVDARVLLTEEDSGLAPDYDPRLPRPADVPFELLPVAPEASWGARWGTLVRYLEERAPCVYLPAGDWRNSNVSPCLSDRVAIISIVPNADPRHYEQVERLGCYWNAIVSPSAKIAARVEELRPEMARRIVRIPPGVDVPASPLSGLVRAGGGPLRIVYHGRLTHRRKRIFELPSIVEALLARGVPVQLTVIGDGRDRRQLMTVSQALAEKGAFRWLGVLPHERILEELQGHDVCLLTSGLDGLPQAVIEAMGCGCVPVVGDTDGLSELVWNDVNGYRVPVGDLEGFCRRLEMLHREPCLRRHLSRAARQTVIERGLSSDCMVEAYAALFRKVMAESAQGAFHRPKGLLRRPPYQVSGTEIFPVRYFRGIEQVGVFPSYRKDYEDYRNALGEPRTGQLPAWRRDLVHPYPVIIAAAPTASGTNVGFVEALARGLQGNDQTTQVLVAPGVSPDSMPCGEGVRVLRTPIGKAPWRPRNRALADYLESQSPCLYLPSDAWLHWSACPHLSDRIGVIGRIDDLDPGSLARTARMGACWNAIVAGSLGVAERLIALNPGLSSRVVTIPMPIDVPKRLSDRLPAWETPLRLAHLNVAGAPHVPATLSQIVAVLTEHDVPVEVTAVAEGSGSVIFERADVFLALSESASDRMRLLEAMGRGCVPVVARGNGSLTEFVKDGENGYVLPDGDISAFAAQLRALYRNPALRRLVSEKAFASAQAFETVDVFVASYSMLFDRVLRDIDLGIHRRSHAPRR